MRSSAEGLTPCYHIYGDQILLPVTSGATYGSGGKPCGPGSDAPNWNGVSYDPNANGYRLPTGAEWEYAAKGGPANDSYLYSGSDDIEAVAWYRDNSGSRTHEVKTKAPNSLGLYDMSGNVWEWCWDNDSPNPPNRVLRSGSLGNLASVCAVSYRYGSGTPYTGGCDVGFRLVRRAD